MSLSSVAADLDAVLSGADVTFASVSIDTRSLQKGDLYVAIQGPSFDGNDFVAEAGRLGACAAVVSRPVSAALPQLLVSNTRLALGKLGQLNRQASGARIVAITGSQGKTTVKEMTGAILSVAGPTLVTAGNLNNDIGVPLTLLRLEQGHRFGVIEMGANHGGEIAYSVSLARPDVALITNAARAHIEGFGSLQGVVTAKGEIIDGLGPEGTMVLNRDDAFFSTWRERAGARRVVSFAIDNPEADYFAARIGADPAGGIRFDLHTPVGMQGVSLHLLGRHNVGNAVAAAALAVEAGAELAAVSSGLGAIRPVKGRLCPVDNDSGGQLIDDSYNASPESFKAAIDVLSGMPGERILLMGDMAELGSISAAAHREIGEYAKQAGVDELWSTGPASMASSQEFGTGGRHIDDRSQLVDYLRSRLQEGVTVLVKGSRRAGLDAVVQQLRRNPENGIKE